MATLNMTLNVSSFDDKSLFDESVETTNCSFINSTCNSTTFSPVTILADGYEMDADMTISSRGYIAIGVVLLVMDIAAIFGNSMVLYVVFKQRSLKRPINLFIANLAVSDLSVAIIGYPLTIVSAFCGRWLFREVGCKMYAFICFTLATNCILTHAMISYYRYLVMCNYNKYKVDSSFVVKALLCAWSFTLFWTLSPLLGWSSYTQEPLPISCSINWHGGSIHDKTYIGCVMVFILVCPLSVMIMSYIKIIKRSNRMVSSKTEVVDPTNLPKFQLDLQKRVTWICFIMTAMFVFTWLPYSIVSIVSASGIGIPNGLISFLPTLFAKASCAYNPFIYCLTNSKFREILAYIFCKQLFKKVGFDKAPDVQLQMNQFLETDSDEERNQTFNIFTISSLRKETSSCKTKSPTSWKLRQKLTARPDLSADSSFALNFDDLSQIETKI